MALDPRYQYAIPRGVQTLRTLRAVAQGGTGGTRFGELGNTVTKAVRGFGIGGTSPSANLTGGLSLASGLSSAVGAADMVAGLITALVSKNAPSKTTQWLSVLGLGGFSSIFDSPINEPFKVFAPLALATDQLRRGIPYNDRRVQARLANFNRRTAPGARFARHLEQAGFPAGTPAEYLLANYDFGSGGSGNFAPVVARSLGTILSSSQRIAMGAPVAANPAAGTALDPRWALTREEQNLLRRIERRRWAAPNLKPLQIPPTLQAKLQAQRFGVYQ